MTLLSEVTSMTEMTMVGSLDYRRWIQLASL